GINVAQRVMSFAEPNQILVSRSYYEIVSRLSQEYTRLFQYVGIHRDKHVREHEVYVMTAGGEGAAAPAPEQAAAAAAGGPPGRVESTEFVPVGGGARFDPAVLTRVECALADSLGPVARILVRKAAKTARDVPALCQQLDGSLSDSQRTEFRRRLSDVVGPPPARPAPKTPPARPAVAPAAAAPAPGRPLSSAVLDEAADRLAIHIGPVAKLLVKRAAKQASSTRDLYERLAAHIDDPDSRQRFAAAVEELSEP